MIQEDRAIVVKVLPRGEDDLLCDLLTEKRGRCWGLARLARKSRKRFGTTLAAGNILRILFDEKGQIPFLLLRETAVATVLAHLTKSLERIGHVFYFLELIREMTPERTPEFRKFELLSEGLKALNEGVDPKKLKSEFEYQLLKISGWEPHLKNCLHCGKESDPAYFVFREGGVVCAGCLRAGSPYEILHPSDPGRIFTPFLEYCIGKKLLSTHLCLP